MKRNFNEFTDFESLELEVLTFCFVTGCVSARRDKRYVLFRYGVRFGTQGQTLVKTHQRPYLVQVGVSFEEYLKLNPSYARRLKISHVQH
jgi:hypothetical protein